jgi:hypothetical protein
MYDVVLESAGLNKEAKIVKPVRRDNRFDPAGSNHEFTSSRAELNAGSWSMFDCETLR